MFFKGSKNLIKVILTILIISFVSFSCSADYKFFIFNGLDNCYTGCCTRIENTETGGTATYEVFLGDLLGFLFDSNSWLEYDEAVNKKVHVISADLCDDIKKFLIEESRLVLKYMAAYVNRLDETNAQNEQEVQQFYYERTQLLKEMKFIKKRLKKMELYKL